MNKDDLVQRLRDERHVRGLEHAAHALFNGDTDCLDFMQRDAAMMAVSRAKSERQEAAARIEGLEKEHVCNVDTLNAIEAENKALRVRITELEAAAQHEREGYETAIALATQVDGLHERIEAREKALDIAKEALTKGYAAGSFAGYRPEFDIAISAIKEVRHD